MQVKKEAEAEERIKVIKRVTSLRNVTNNYFNIKFINAAAKDAVTAASTPLRLRLLRTL